MVNGLGALRARCRGFRPNHRSPITDHAFSMERTMTEKIKKTDAEWKKQLSPEQFQVTRRHGTERAFTGRYWDNHENGAYRCVCCGAELFSSEHKFESGSGWPSFWQPARKENVESE